MGVKNFVEKLNKQNKKGKKQHNRRADDKMLLRMFEYKKKKKNEKSHPDRVCSQCNRLTNSLLIGCTRKRQHIVFYIQYLTWERLNPFFFSFSFCFSSRFCFPLNLLFVFSVYSVYGLNELASCSCFIYVFIGWLWILQFKNRIKFIC